MINKSNIVSLLIALPLLTFWSCASTETTSDETSEESVSEETIDSENSSQESSESTPLISSLSDTYSSNQNNIPSVYSEIKKEKEVEVDLTKGFRIQIYSGQDVFEADTVAASFRAWSDTTLVGYQAETYTFFKTPYYKVHIGDFHNRTRALDFSKMVKRLFRDAWVVYDTVNPYLVPEDTTEIKFQDL